MAIVNPALDENAVLKVYRRRLTMADNKYERGRAEREKFLSRYGLDGPTEGQITEEGHAVSVTSGVGIIDTMFATMTAVDVEFLVTNLGTGTRAQALATTNAVNQSWRDTKGQRRAKDAIKDALVVDIGWVKVYYDYRDEEVLREIPEDAVRAQILELAAKNHIDPKDIPDEEIETAERVNVVLRDRVCVEYVPWDMVRADPTAKRIENVRWVCQYTRLPAYEVQNHPTWNEYVVDRYGAVRGRQLMEDIKGDSTIDTWDDPTFAQDVERDRWEDDRWVTVAEMWDLETGLVTVFPRSGCDVVLHQRENPLMMNVDLEDRNPFKPLIVRKDTRQLEGLGDMRVITPALNELDTYRTNLATYVERTVPKLIGPEEGMTQQGKNALKSPVWGELIGTSNVDGNAYKVLTPPPLPQEVFALQERIQLEMRDGTGVSEPMKGVFPTKRTTATETRIVTDRGDARQSERRSALEEWYLSIARTIIQLMQVYYTKDRMVRYVDESGQEFEWIWNAEDISEEPNILVSITPRESPTRDERVQRFLLLMNLAMPLPEADRAEFVRTAAMEMGYRQDEINALIKSQQEVDAEQELAQARSLGAAPQPGAPGLTLTPGA